MANSNVPLNPTFIGHVASTLDALVLFEACLSSALQHVPRRPHDRERQDLIKSGNVFIYEEHSSGIKRWTDGVAWSPSRILGNFLIYRELDRPFPPGEKKRAMKRTKKTTGVTKPSDVGSRQPTMNGTAPAMGMGDTSSSNKDAERALIGSLVDSYPFKENGLVKKTISVTYQGVPHHLVSYYNVEDVTEGRLMTPSKDTRLSTIIPRGELIMSQNFRAPIDEVEMDDQRGAHTGMFTHGYPVGGHPALSRTMSVPSLNHPIGGMGGPPFGQSYMAPYMPTAVGGSVGGVPYTQPPHHSYPYDHIGQRHRYPSSAGLGHDMSRTMTLEPQHQPRRHSTAYEATTGGDMNLAGGVPSVADPARNYMTSMMYQHRVSDMSPPDGFPAQSPRNVHTETGMGSDRTQGMSFEGIAAREWSSFDPLEDDQGQYMPPATAGWPNSTNSMGRG
ncbi:camp independent regulatory protein [Colletotrichum sojae]|uniref:Camp independent regulatory protein n=1 Tax=Colletotrichum sojae TaxID=2175907 RepID=A0A8H6MN51_9PEZI|nr:camp independent regulatory protein [Colletotrichum sojae]